MQSLHRQTQAAAGQALVQPACPNNRAPWLAEDPGRGPPPLSVLSSGFPVPAAVPAAPRWSGSWLIGAPGPGARIYPGFLCSTSGHRCLPAVPARGKGKKPLLSEQVLHHRHKAFSCSPSTPPGPPSQWYRLVPVWSDLRDARKGTVSTLSQWDSPMGFVPLKCKCQL